MAKTTQSKGAVRSWHGIGRRHLPIGGAVVATVAGGIALAGCTSDDGAAVPAPQEPTNIAGTAVEIVDGAVVSTCFTFDMPTLAEYEMNPNSAGCYVAIRWAEGDSLTEIDIMPQKGDNSIDYFFDDIGGYTTGDEEALPPPETITVSGAPAGRAYAFNSYGLMLAFYFIPETTGAFENDGVPITSFLISGPAGGEDLRNVLDDLVESFQILN
jgi:hypothetical protein